MTELKKKQGKVVNLKKASKSTEPKAKAFDKDPSKYGFLPNTKVMVDANKYIIYLHQFLTYIAMNERKETLEIGKDAEETRNNYKVVTSPMGFQAAEFGDAIMQDFMGFIDDGTAVHISEIKKAQEAELKKAENKTNNAK